MIPCEEHSQQGVQQEWREEMEHRRGMLVSANARPGRPYPDPRVADHESGLLRPRSGAARRVWPPQPALAQWRCLCWRRATGAAPAEDWNALFRSKVFIVQKMQGSRL